MTHDSHPTGVHCRARGRMAVHTIWDYITRPIAKTIDDVPWCAEAISPDWLTAVLCGRVKGARVVSVEICGGDQGSQIAWIGTGIMGAPMARRLLRAGHNVTVFNRTRTRAQALEADGAVVTDSPAQTVSSAAVIFTMVPDTPHREPLIHHTTPTFYSPPVA